MLTKERVLKLLENVKDPEIGASITKLNMIKSIEIKNGIVKVLVSLTIASCPLYNVIEENIKRELLKDKEVKDVIVDFTVMGEKEKEELTKRISGKAMETVKKTWFEFSNKWPRFNFKKIIAIASAKGGVGKSTVTSLIASQLRKRKLEVGILDADLTGSTIAHAFGIERSRIYAANPIPPESKTGIKIISVNFLLENPEDALMWRGPLLSQALAQFYNNINWGKLDFLLIDMPPGSSDIPLTIFQFLPVDGIILVSTPQEISRKIVKKSVNMASKMNVKMLGIIENMSYFVCKHCKAKNEIFGSGKVEKLCKEYKIPFLGKIPIDEKVTKLFDEGKIEKYESEEINFIVNKILEKV